MRALLMSLSLVMGGVAAGACGSSVGNKAAGEACHASSECGPDLVCDFSQTPATCAQQGPAPADAAVIDGRPIPGQPDAKPVFDAKPPAPDAATPDAADPVDAAPPDAADPVDAM